MAEDEGFQKIGKIMGGQRKKPPAYPWQEFALRVIDELKIPNFKRGAVFKVCKENPKPFVEHCLNETKELCESPVKWKYFFKLVAKKGEEEK